MATECTKAVNRRVLAWTETIQWHTHQTGQDVAVSKTQHIGELLSVFGFRF